MAWTDSLVKLRSFLADNDNDRLRHRKAIFGLQDGTNATYITFEDRRVTDFSDPATSAPLGVYVNGMPATVTVDYPVIGEFTLTTAPQNGDTIEATYYYQWFQDSDLATFLENAGNWANYPDITAVPYGLQPAVLRFAAADAYQNLALKFAESDSEKFRLEDAPDPKNRSAASSYMAMSKEYRNQALDQRKQFYTRQDQNESPLFGTVIGRVRNPVPTR